MSEVSQKALAEAIKNLHGVDAKWVEAIPVEETFEGQIVWHGEVQVFDLKGHPEAARCYGGHTRCPAASDGASLSSSTSLPLILPKPLFVLLSWLNTNNFENRCLQIRTLPVMQIT